MSNVDLSMMKLDWQDPISLSMIGFSLLAKILEITLISTLQREIGQNWLRDSRASVFGIKQIIMDSFQPGGISPVSEILTKACVIDVPTKCQYFWGGKKNCVEGRPGPGPCEVLVER